MKRTWTMMLATLLCATGGLLLLVRDRLPGGDGIAARLDFDGATYLVTQEWQHWSEPYEVSFYVKDREARWGWCYMDHQSDRLRNVKLRRMAAGEGVEVYVDDRLRARYSSQGLTVSTFDGYGKLIELSAPSPTVGPTFSLFTESGRLTRTLPAPGAWMEPPAALVH
jgi:hypothetical protein